MKGFIGKLVAVLGGAGALAGMSGCHLYRDLVDPCYPERYWHASRQNVHAAFAPQVRNGHVLDQTLYLHHFECGTDRLTPGGIEHLNYLARRRPCPDPVVFVQTALDAPCDPCNIEQFVCCRADLDQRRIAAVKKYLCAATAGGHAPAFEVYIHNPPDVSIAGPAADVMVRQLYSTPRATLPGTGGTSGGGGGGAGGGR